MKIWHRKKYLHKVMNSPECHFYVSLKHFDLKASKNVFEKNLELLFYQRQFVIKGDIQKLDLFDKQRSVAAIFNSFFRIFFYVS